MPALSPLETSCWSPPWLFLFSPSVAYRIYTWNITKNILPYSASLKREGVWILGSAAEHAYSVQCYFIVLIIIFNQYMYMHKYTNYCAFLLHAHFTWNIRGISLASARMTSPCVTERTWNNLLQNTQIITKINCRNKLLYMYVCGGPKSPCGPKSPYCWKSPYGPKSPCRPNVTVSCYCTTFS